MGCGCTNNSWGRSRQHGGCGCSCEHRPPINPCMEKARDIRSKIDELEQLLACTCHSLYKAYGDLELIEEAFDDLVKDGCIKDIRPREPECCDCECNCGCECPPPRPQPRCGCECPPPKPQPRCGCECPPPRPQPRCGCECPPPRPQPRRGCSR